MPLLPSTPAGPARRIWGVVKSNHGSDPGYLDLGSSANCDIERQLPSMGPRGTPASVTQPSQPFPARLQAQQGGFGGHKQGGQGSDPGYPDLGSSANCDIERQLPSMGPRGNPALVTQPCHFPPARLQAPQGGLGGQKGELVKVWLVLPTWEALQTAVSQLRYLPWVPRGTPTFAMPPPSPHTEPRGACRPAPAVQ